MRLARSVRRTLSRLGMLLVAGGCQDPESPQPFSEYPFALATPSCGPADGPAMAIFLTPTEVSDVPATPPYFQFFLTRSAAELEGRTWLWPSADETASAWECTMAGGACAGSPTGAIALGHFAADSAIAVTVDLRREGGQRVRGQFTARWHSRPLACG